MIACFIFFPDVGDQYHYAVFRQYLNPPHFFIYIGFFSFGLAILFTLSCFILIIFKKNKIILAKHFSERRKHRH
jgi:hypothetical protein